jgi:hypothetical protein
MMMTRHRWRPAGHSRESGASLAPGLARLHASRLMLMCVSPVLRIHRNSLGLLGKGVTANLRQMAAHFRCSPKAMVGRQKPSLSLKGQKQL